MSKSKLVAGSMFLVCSTLVVGMGLYLPFYSSAAKAGEEARRQLHAKEPGQQKAPGGVWKNLNSAAKQAKGTDAAVNDMKDQNGNSASVKSA